MRRIESTRLLWLVALVAATVLSVVFCTVYTGYNWDVYLRYAPMADEFAAGNWREAFHPSYGVFMSVAAGTVAKLLHVSGITACRIVSTFGWCLAAVPLWHFARKAYGEDVAWVSVAGLFLIPQFWDYSSAGLRDTVRILAYALMAWGFLSRSVWIAVGLFLQVTLRVDGLAVAGVAWVAYLVLCAHRRSRTALVAPTLGLAAGLLANSFMVYAYTGHFLPASQLIPLFGRWL